MHTESKTKQNKAKTTRQASRRTMPIPEKLKVIIELVNSIPPEKELPIVQRLWDQLNQEALNDYQNWYESRRQELEDHKNQLGPISNEPEYTTQLLQYVQKQLDLADDQVAQTHVVTDAIGRGIDAVNLCLEGFPKNIRDYVWQVGEDQLERETSLYEAMYRYTFVQSSRKRLRMIAKLALVEASERTIMVRPDLAGYSQITIDEDGIISVGNDRFSAAVDGLDARRIRQCEICKRIFWAGRINQPCCSTACAHSLRNRRYRARYKDYLVNQHLKETSAAAVDAKPSKTGKGKNKKDS